jgi:hypothetical protein
MRVMNAMRGKGSKVQERSTDVEDDEEVEEDRKQRENIEALKKNWDNTKIEGANTEAYKEAGEEREEQREDHNSKEHNLLKGTDDGKHMDTIGHIFSEEKEESKVGGKGTPHGHNN